MVLIILSIRIHHIIIKQLLFGRKASYFVLAFSNCIYPKKSPFMGKV
ncbi:hypothetical protein BACEGG_00651 [Bacteroides eggerthii DSM 20697]|nr:hypothetical protein BACEGG_00651 [Bacteroides eggerthii DSM 20697]